MLIFGIFGTAGFFVSDFNILLIFRFISGMGAASLGALNVALIGDLFRGEQRLKVVGYNNSALNLGTTIIPVLGGFLARIHWNYVFLLPSAAVLLALWLLFSFKDTVINVSGGRKYFRDYFQAIKDRRIFIIFIVSILTYIILFGSLWTYIPFLIEKKFLSSSVINGFVIAGMSLTASITSVFFSRISGKYNQEKLFIFIFIVKLIALVSVIYMPEWYYLFIPMVIFGIGFGLNLPNIQSLIIKYSPE
ncbi:MAG: MFS transporter, partial [Ignavibacteria bacterium]|nr:MFS transporter [Ignavibacteria bacterium]